MKSDLSSICILRLSAIGDVCNAIAVVQEIQRFYPNAKITWIVGKGEHSLVKVLPGINFYVFDKSEGFKAYRKLRKNLDQKFDVLLHMQLALRANLIAALIKADKKIGFPAHLSKELHGLVVNSRCDIESRPHVVDGFRAFAYALDIPLFQLKWDIPIASEDKSYVKCLISTAKPILAITPAASNFERNWLADRYAKFADYAYKKGFEVVLCSGPSTKELELVDQIISYSSSPLVNLSGKFSLLQLLYFLRGAAVLVSPDTGPAHMAVSQNTSVIGLYAHSNPERTGPYRFRSYVVSVYREHIESQKGCSIEKVRWGTRAKGVDLMRSIEVSDVCEMLDHVVQSEGLEL